MSQEFLSQFNKGGLSNSLYSGYPGSYARDGGLDIHTDPGIVKPALRLEKISGTEISSFCREGLKCSNGNDYFFSLTNGKVWEVQPDNTTTLMYQIYAASGINGVLGVFEFEEHLYIATANQLHRIPVSGLDDWDANFELNFANFTVGNTEHHPMMEQNLELWIGDGDSITQVYNGTFTPDVNFVLKDQVITTMARFGTDLIVGTATNATANVAEVVRFNTYGRNFLDRAVIPEVAVTAIYATESLILIMAGYAGAIYQYNGDNCQYWRSIPGDYSADKKAVINHASTTILTHSLGLIGVSNVSGNPCDMGIYSIGGHSAAYPMVLNFEYATSERDNEGWPLLQDIKIGAIIATNTDLLVSCSRTNEFGTTNWIDRLSPTKRLEKTFMETMRFIAQDDRGEPHRFSSQSFGPFGIAYERKDSTTEIKILYRRNYEEEWHELELYDDPDKLILEGNDNASANVMQLRIELHSTDTEYPTIEEVAINAK